MAAVKGFLYDGAALFLSLYLTMKNPQLEMKRTLNAKQLKEMLVDGWTSGQPVRGQTER